MKRNFMTACGSRCLWLIALVIMAMPAWGEASIAISDNRATETYWTKNNSAGDKVLLSAQEITALNRTMRTKSDSLVDLAAFDVNVPAASVKEMILKAQQDYRGESTPGEVYDASGKAISTASYAQAQANCNLKALQGTITGKYALTTERIK